MPACVRSVLSAAFAASILESDAFTEEFCTDCPAIKTFSGPTEGGIPIGPDETDCPSGFCIDDDCCIRYADWKRIDALADEIATIAERKL